MNEKNLIDLAEVHRRAGLRPRLIREWVWRSRRGLPIPAYARALLARLERVGARWKIAESDLADWIREQRRSKAARTHRRPSEPVPLAEIVDGVLRELARLRERLIQGGES